MKSVDEWSSHASAAAAAAAGGRYDDERGGSHRRHVTMLDTDGGATGSSLSNTYSHRSQSSRSPSNTSLMVSSSSLATDALTALVSHVRGARLSQRDRATPSVS